MLKSRGEFEDKINKIVKVEQKDKKKTKKSTGFSVKRSFKEGHDYF